MTLTLIIKILWLFITSAPAIAFWITEPNVLLLTYWFVGLYITSAFTSILPR